MKYLKLFERFKLNEISSDSATNNRMGTESPKMIEQAKKIEGLLQKSGLKMVTKEVTSSDEKSSLMEEYIGKVQEEGCKECYCIMQGSGDMCQSFSIIAPDSAIETLQKPFYCGGRKISYRETPGKFCTLEVYNSPGKGESTSTYMQADGEVLFQWDETSSQGTLKGQATQL
jgi:hypothetical protein